MPTLDELNAMLADPGFQERHREFERQIYERLEPLGDAIRKMKKPTPPAQPDSSPPAPKPRAKRVWKVVFRTHGQLPTKKEG